MEQSSGRTLAIVLAGAGTAALIAGTAALMHRARARRELPNVKKRPAADPALPRGWRRYLGPLTPALTGAARVALEQHRPIGSLVPLVVEGKEYGAFIEWHTDPKRGRHPGVSLLVPG